eukprot:SAG22_NODE_457_length_10262_cov_17.627964_6_plen_228_part_00
MAASMWWGVAPGRLRHPFSSRHVTSSDTLNAPCCRISPSTQPLLFSYPHAAVLHCRQLIVALDLRHILSGSSARSNYTAPQSAVGCMHPRERLRRLRGGLVSFGGGRLDGVGLSAVGCMHPGERLRRAAPGWARQLRGRAAPGRGRGRLHGRTPCAEQRQEKRPHGWRVLSQVSRSSLREAHSNRLQQTGSTRRVSLTKDRVWAFYRQSLGLLQAEPGPFRGRVDTF